MDRENRIAFIISKFTKFVGPRCADRRIFWLAQIANVCLLVTLLTQVIAVLLATGDSKKLFEFFSIFTFCCMGALKLKSLHFNHKQWLILVVQADDMENEQLLVDMEVVDEEYESENEGSESYFVRHIESYSDQFRSLSVILIRIYIFTLVIFILSPFIEYGYWKINGVEMVGSPHILPGWAPLERLGLGGYLCTVVAEIIAAVYIVIVHTVFDLTAFGIMIFLSGQFSLLREYSKNIGGRGNCYNLSKERDARAHYRIKKCQKTLMILENSFMSLNNLIRDILGIYYFVAMLTLCAVAMRLSTEEISLMQLISLLQYTAGILMQLFLFCYYGDMVLHKSTVGMGQGPYAAAHWCLSPRVRRELALLGGGLARVRRMRAGPFNSLNLPSFIQILRAAYSTYAVLHK